MRRLAITKSITRRDSASIERYLQEIGKEELIDATEEVNLAKRIKQGDMIALEKLVKANMRFVVSVAKQYDGSKLNRRGLGLNDLINAGNEGLVKAALRFDHTKGFKFISYAVWWIRQSIIQFTSENSRLVRLPLNVIGSVRKIKKTTSQFGQENDRDPTDDELSELLELETDVIRKARQSDAEAVSLDVKIDEEQERSTSRIDLLSNEESLEDMLMPENRESLRAALNKVLERLDQNDPRMGIIMRRSCGITSSGREETLEDIADDLNLSRERVRQLKVKAERFMRRLATRKDFKEELF
jgi:RNA polymerase primary sigma factor